MVWQVLGLGTDLTQDPQISVKNFVSTNWGLTAPLAAPPVTFGTGWYNMQLQFQIHFRHDYFPRETQYTIGANWVHKYDDFVNVHVWVQMQNTNAEPTQLGQIFREIERIIGSNPTGLKASQGISFMKFIEPMHTVPEEESEETLFHGFGTIMLRYNKKNV